jgi:hypothetical protein
MFFKFFWLNKNFQLEFKDGYTDRKIKKINIYFTIGKDVGDTLRVSDNFLLNWNFQLYFTSKNTNEKIKILIFNLL